MSTTYYRDDAVHITSGGVQVGGAWYPLSTLTYVWHRRTGRLRHGAYLMASRTAALGVVQTRMVLDLVRRLRDQGLAVMVISHNLNDVFEVADRIAVMYLGRLVVQQDATKFDRQSVVEYMTTGGSSRSGGRAKES